MNFPPILFFIFLLSPIFGFGQNGNTKDEVQSMFKNHSKIQWIKHYEGRIDDLNDISVTLGFDGVDCKGRLTYLRSKATFDLLGKIEHQRIWLQEFNASKKVSGDFDGKISNTTITGNWKNYNGQKGGHFYLEETEKETKFPSYCGDNKWIRKYEGKISSDQAELILQKESNEKLSGLIFYQKKETSYLLQGDLEASGDFEIKVKDQTGQTVQILVGSLEQDQLTIGSKKMNKKNTLPPTDGLTIGCVEYADYMTGYDITFPKTTNAAFNQRMEEETDAWIKACRNHTQKIKKQNTSNQPRMRATERGYAWCEVDFFSKNLISGFMTFSNTWTPGQKLIAFNFDFEENSTIYLEEVFNKKNDYKKFIKNYIKKEIKKHQLYKDADFKKWIKKSDFPFFTIRRDGICFSTKHSMLYGRQNVTIPYRQLQPFLQQSFLKKLSTK